MGRGKNRRGRGGGRGGVQRGGGGRKPVRADYSEMTKTHELFEQYYNTLGLIGDEEKEVFWDFLRRDLPNSFRFTGSKGQAVPVQQLLKTRYIPEIVSIEHDGQLVAPPTVIPWFPDQLAWEMTTPKNIIRRFPPFASFQKFLVSETSVGNISRQEAVSMIPPLLMDIKPGMAVLDMCAAPGSKAAQLIEMVHGGEEARLRKINRENVLDRGREPSPEAGILKEELQEEEDHGDWSDDGRATGLLIANDSDYKRAHLLTHQMKRLNSPNILVTNHDATMFPSIKLQASSKPDNGPVSAAKYLKFDRILADVPCSGDGTCRKNINVWMDWTPTNAFGLHSTQVRILHRALQMLKVGGRVVYSTCSMNPVENEAVVAAALKQCGGSATVELLDSGEALPLLKRRTGLKTWKVMDKQGRFFDSFAELSQARIEAGGDVGKLSPTIFPPLEPAEDLHLERCMRVYPHLQDTGGFFIAVLEKKSEIKAKGQDSSNGTSIHQPAAPVAPPAHTSIISAVNEIESLPTDTGKADSILPKVSALDELLPPTAKPDTENADISPAARQNQPVGPTDTGSITGTKRAFDAAADAEAANKKPKFREEIDDPAPQGFEDRQVHYPPPPGAVLNLTRQEFADKTAEEPKVAVGSAIVSSGGRKPNQQARFEEPYRYLSPDHPDLVKIQRFYGLPTSTPSFPDSNSQTKTDKLPGFPFNRFMVRNPTGIPTKTIYYSSALAKTILTANEGSGIKFIHCGVKMFVRQDVQAEDVCAWRIQTEGLPVLAGWVGLAAPPNSAAEGANGDEQSRTEGPEGRIVRLHRKSTLRHLLTEMFPKVEGGGWESLGEIGPRVRDIGMGCCVLKVGAPPKGVKVEEGEEVFGADEKMVLPLWRSMHSLNLMLPKEERRAMMIRLFGEEGEVRDTSKERFERRKKMEMEKDDGEEEVKREEEEEVIIDVDVDVKVKDEEEEEEKAGNTSSAADGDEKMGGVPLPDHAVKERGMEIE